MILTVTTNPSVDYLYEINELKVGDLNRVKKIKKMGGGKGINAARVSSLLNEETFATGFVGGENGKFILQNANEDKYRAMFVQTGIETRNCYTIIQKGGEKTEINEFGESLSVENTVILFNQIKKILSSQKISALSINGSLAPGMPKDSYNKLIKMTRQLSPDTQILLDTSESVLKQTLVLDELPDIIKPNEKELAALTGHRTTTNPDKIKKIIQENIFLSRIPTILVSLGSKGAVIKKKNKFYQAIVPPQKTVNTEGSGDSLVGGLLAAVNKGLSFEDRIKYAIAAGTANALEAKTGYLSMNNFNRIMTTIEILTF